MNEQSGPLISPSNLAFRNLWHKFCCLKLGLVSEISHAFCHNPNGGLIVNVQPSPHHHVAGAFLRLVLSQTDY